MAEMGNGSALSLASSTVNDRSSRLSTVPRQREIDELRTKLDEAEKKADKEIKALNQEVRLTSLFLLLIFE